jgi:hypothetical protein
MNTGQAAQPSAAETKKAKRRVSDKNYYHGKKLEVNEQYDPLHIFFLVLNSIDC